MREILFRAKTIDTSKWVEGNLLHGYCRGENEPCIASDKYQCTFEVILDTVGQYTGLTDKNGKKIFEGDILRYYSDARMYLPTKNGGWTLEGDSHVEEKTLVEWDNDFATYVIHGSMNLAGMNSITEIIGNIYDNPELLEEGAE